VWRDQGKGGRMRWCCIILEVCKKRNAGRVKAGILVGVGGGFCARGGRGYGKKSMEEFLRSGNDR
jgi:hypothetical protein